MIAVEENPKTWKFIKDPWPHQLEGLIKLVQNQYFYLADDMGTGKSKQIVDYVCNTDTILTLIACPKAVVPVWGSEFDKHRTCPITVVCLDRGTIAQRAHTLRAAVHAGLVLKVKVVIVVNYEAVWRADIGKAVSRIKWDLVACDEAHKIKSASGVTSRFFGRLIRLPNQHRACLSGTPLAHSPLDAFGQYRFLDSTIFGKSYTRFRSRFAIMGGFQGKQVLDFQNMEEFNQRFYSIARRVMSDEVIVLPEFKHVDVPVSLSTAERRVYEQMDLELVADVQGGIVTAANAAVRVIRLQQMTGGFCRNPEGVDVPVGTSKQDALTCLMDGIDPKEKIVVFCRFRPDIERIRWQCADPLGRVHFELSGKENTLRQWKEHTKTGAVLAVQIASGGTGIDLTASSKVIYYSTGHNLGDYEQSLKRVHRPGQECEVTYWHLNATNTRDVTIYRAMRNRANVIAEILKEMNHG